MANRLPTESPVNPEVDDVGGTTSPSPAEATHDSAQLDQRAREMMDVLLGGEAVSAEQFGAFVTVLQAISAKLNVRAFTEMAERLDDESAFQGREAMRELSLRMYHTENALLASRIPNEERAEGSQLRQNLERLRNYYRGLGYRDREIDELDLMPGEEGAKKRVRIHRLFERANIDPVEEFPRLWHSHFRVALEASHLDDAGKLALLREANDSPRTWSPTALRVRIQEERRQRNLERAQEASSAGTEGEEASEDDDAISLAPDDETEDDNSEEMPLAGFPYETQVHQQRRQSTDFLSELEIVLRGWDPNASAEHNRQVMADAVECCHRHKGSLDQLVEVFESHMRELDYQARKEEQS